MAIAELNAITYPDSHCFPPMTQGPAASKARRRQNSGLVALHGWGADADDLLDLGEELGGPAWPLWLYRLPSPIPTGWAGQWLRPAQPEWQGAARPYGLRQRLLVPPSRFR